MTPFTCNKGRVEEQRMYVIPWENWQESAGKAEIEIGFVSSGDIC